MKMDTRTIVSVLVLLAPWCFAQSNGKTFLFYDRTLITKMDPRLTLELEPPVKGERVVSPTEPWESWAVFGYNSVVAGNGTRPHRLYYDCIEGDGVPPGLGNSEQEFKLSARRICLATSNDGLVWTKPRLGIFNRNGSTANNIVLEDSGNSVFIDTKPGVPESQRWKMVCSQSAYASPDGLKWTQLPFKPTAEDDTKPTAYYDPNLGKYVIFVRRDIDGRKVGRCVTDNISDWQTESPNGCPVVLQTDMNDPLGVDIYTNAYTPYPSIENPLIHILFPSYYFHFGASTPWGFGNDGLLDIRFISSRDGVHFNYTETINGRSPYVPLGINTCGGEAHAPGVKGGWCSPSSGVESQTNFDTSAMYMASGYVMSSAGDQVYFYASGQAATHGGDAVAKKWGNQTGIRVLQARKDGFVSVKSPYIFNAPAPNFTMIPMTIPTGCPPPKKTESNNTQRSTGCAYEFPGDVCPPSEPTAKCVKDSDCHRLSDHPTCHGVDVTCKTGICQNGLPGGVLCESATSNHTTITSEGVVLRVNHLTSVVGSVAFELQENGTGIPGFVLQDSDLLKGNSLDSIVSWNGGTMASLSALAGKTVSLTVALRDAKVFSVSVGCY